jgi:hypothetical protein
MENGREVRTGIGMSYRLDDRGLISVRGEIFLFSIASRLALGPTQPSIQCAPGVKWQGVKLTTHHHLDSRSRMMELYKCVA